jgi:hypothetical protein
VAPAIGPVVFDSAVLILAERDAPQFRALRAALHEERQLPAVPLPLLAEVWRDGARQANLVRALKATEKADCTEVLAKRAGELLAATAGTNAMDAIVVATAEQRLACVITGDPQDLAELAMHCRPRVRIVPI